jgi:hypothetical protein
MCNFTIKTLDIQQVSVIHHQQGDHISIRMYKTRRTIQFLKLYYNTVVSVGRLNVVQRYSVWDVDIPYSDTGI